MDEPVDALVTWMAAHLEIPATAFAEYARQVVANAKVLAAHKAPGQVKYVCTVHPGMQGTITVK